MSSSTLKFLLLFFVVCIALPSPCSSQVETDDPLVKKGEKKEAAENQDDELSEEEIEQFREDFKKFKEELEDEEPEEHVRSGRSMRRVIRGAIGIVVVIGGFGVKLLFGTLGESSSGASDDSEEFNEIKIKTRCDHCKKGYRVSVKKVGQVIKCKQCGKSFSIQDASV